MTINNSSKRTTYYGWYVCAAAMFIGFCATGARQSFGVFVVPMSDEFGWSRLEVSSAAALGVLVNGVSQPFMGRIFDWTGGRKLVLGSVALLGASTMLMALTFHILFLAFMFGVVLSLAQSGSGPTNMAAMMARWFRRRRGFAISMNSAAVSTGSLVLVPFAMYLMQATNWRTAWLGLGLIILLAIPTGILFFHRSPSDKGLSPDGDPEPPPNKTGGVSSEITGPLEAETWRDSLRSAPIWQMSASYFVCGMTTFVMSVHFIPYAQSQGVSPGLAAIIFGFMMGLNVLGALGSGYLSDKVGDTKNWLALAYFIRGIAYLLLLTLPAPLNLWIFAVFAGFSWVATPVLTSSLTADVYGLKALGTISGLTFMFHQFGGFSSVLLAGLLFDVTGSYTIPFAIAGALLVPASLSAFSIKERKYSVRYQAHPTSVTSSAADVSRDLPYSAN